MPDDPLWTALKRSCAWCGHNRAVHERFEDACTRDDCHCQEFQQADEEADDG